jgi:hypothetical protein
MRKAEEFLAALSVAMYCLLLTGCFSTLSFSLLKFDTKDAAQAYATVELEKVKAGMYQPTFIPGADGAATNQQQGVGGMIPTEDYAKILAALVNLKGEIRILGVDWNVKSEDQPQKYEKVITDGQTLERRSFGTQE